jgi:hypothetical protein
MTDASAEDATRIEHLLADRRRLQDWLGRLDAAGSKAPPAVRNRVRADYEARLAEVVASLRGYTAALTRSLEQLQLQRDEVDARRVQIEEELAEAELRHAVGEYTAEEWEARQRESSARLDSLADELVSLTGEITRLEEVLAQVAPPPDAGSPVTRPRRMPGDDFEPEPVEPGETAEADVTVIPRGTPHEADLIVEPEPVEPPVGSARADEPARPLTPEAPRFTPREGPAIIRPRERERGASRTLRFPQPSSATPAAPPMDEISFIRSVSVEKAPAETAAPGSPRASKATGGQRTLKCSDCGAMNRPTEWYCEKCGAELATL